VLELDDGTTLHRIGAICGLLREMVPTAAVRSASTIERAEVEKCGNRRMEIELLLPTIDVFVHTHPFWTGKREQMPAWKRKTGAPTWFERMRLARQRN